jgi:aldose 1-epimerase
MNKQRLFGTMPTGEPVHEYTLANARGVSVKIINYGGIITQLHVPDRDGQFADVVLGFDNLGQYLAGHPHFGCITGRVAGRITKGQFSLDGVDYKLAINNPPNHLHGGRLGFDKRLWTVDVGRDSFRRPFRETSNRGGMNPALQEIAPQTQLECTSGLTLSYLSPDGEEGYPGNVRVNVSYSLTDASDLVIDYAAVTDKATPLSLTNHSYFNLAGEGSIGFDDQRLQIFADEYDPADEDMTLQGRREAVVGLANDFRLLRRVREALPDLWKRHGDNYFLRRGADSVRVPAARLVDRKSGRVMDVSTTEPCLQFYTGVSLDGTLVGKSGRSYGPHAALCLECQGYPNGVNDPHLGDIVLRPRETYRQSTVYSFSTTG